MSNVLRHQKAERGGGFSFVFRRLRQGHGDDMIRVKYPELRFSVTQTATYDHCQAVFSIGAGGVGRQEFSVGRNQPLGKYPHLSPVYVPAKTVGKTPACVLVERLRTMGEQDLYRGGTVMTINRQGGVFYPKEVDLLVGYGEDGGLVFQKNHPRFFQNDPIRFVEGTADLVVAADGVHGGERA